MPPPQAPRPGRWPTFPGAARIAIRRHPTDTPLTPPRGLLGKGDFASAGASTPMSQTDTKTDPSPQADLPAPTACLVLADGQVFYGHGFGAPGLAVAELCFNTAMTGYQEIMTAPSYAGQIVTFTFPHIGNTGVTPEDDETATPVAEGMIVRWDPTDPSSWRAAGDLPDWLARNGRIGMGGDRHPPADPASSATRARPMSPCNTPRTAISTSRRCTPKRRVSRASKAPIWRPRCPARSPINGMRPAGPGRVATPTARASTRWSPSTTAPSATSCAASSMPDAR